MTNQGKPSSDFNFQSNFIDIYGDKMHYVEEGQGEPFLFLHGNPTSSYLWRNIIPYISPLGRCIAPDLIGMGRSHAPKLKYRFEDHYKYIEGFIERMNLKNITLVLHDWGSGLGFHYAKRNEEKIRGLAFMEALVKPFSWSDFPTGFRLGFQIMRTPGLGWLMVSVMNAFVHQIMPRAVLRTLTIRERAHYAIPFQTVRSRKPVRQWPCEIPIDGKPVRMFKVVSDYSRWLQETSLPKLLLYANPGGIINADAVDWCRKNFKNLKMANIGKGLHYVQEDNPHGIGEALSDWAKQLSET